MAFHDTLHALPIANVAKVRIDSTCEPQLTSILALGRDGVFELPNVTSLHMATQLGLFGCLCC